MMKRFFAAVAVFATAATASAQATYTAASGDEYTFNRHWFLNLQGGAQYTLGEASFSDLLSPNVQLGLGYQFSPVIGLRGQVNGLWSKGGFNGYMGKDGNSAPYTANYKYNYVAPGLDLMVNLSNLIWGWNPERTVSLTAFVGGGVNVGYGNDEVNEIAAGVQNKSNYLLDYVWDGTKVRPFGRAGLDLDFRLSKKVSITLEGNANIISDKYNSKKAGNSDWYFNALAGLRINLGKCCTKKAKPAPAEPAPVPAPAPVVEEKPAPAPVVEPQVEEIRRDVFFVINSNTVTAAEQQKVKEVVDYLNRYPEAKVIVTGYADAGTGNDAINDRIAQRRADAVTKLLTEQYGIAADRITTASKGARVQPFQENDQNRVTIMTAKP